MSRQSSKTASRRPPKDGAPSNDPNEKDGDWGFEQDDDEKTIEPRLGFVLAACLLLMFGFVLYNKYQQTKAGAKQSVTQEGTGPKSSNSEEGLPGEEKLPTAPQSFVSTSPEPATESSRSFDPFGERTPTPAEPNLATAPNEASSGSFNPFAGEQVVTTSETPPSSSLPSQEEPSPFDEEPFPEPADAGDFNMVENSPPPPPSDEPLFDLKPTSIDTQRSSSGNESESETVPSDEQFAASTPEPDPFGLPSAPLSPEADTSPVEQQEPEPLEAMDLAMPLSPLEPEPDPFAGSDFNESSLAQPEAEPNPFGKVADIENSTSSEPVNELVFPTDEWPEETPPKVPEQPVDAFAAREEPIQSPALPSLPNASPSNGEGDESGFGWELEPVPSLPSSQTVTPEPAFGRPQPRSFSASPPESVISEREVTVTRNDSLWSIAQDAYGTARYVPALAQYNKDRVPHPDKLKLGVKLRIPPPEVLEGRFPNMFRTTNRRDTLISPTGAQATHTSTTAQAGFFLDRQGRPVCRVGEDDTLTRIAQRYLGRSSRWTDIYGMNGDQLKSPETLKPGMILRLPADATRVAVDDDASLSR